MYDLTKIFEIQEDTEDQVIVKIINNDDALVVAQYPFINSELAYVTITKGDQHIVTKINKDGKTDSFHFGFNGYTIIGETTKLLKEQLLKFIEEKGISLRKP